MNVTNLWIGVFLLLLCHHIDADQSNTSSYVAVVAQTIVNLGRYGQCLADHADTANDIDQINQAADTTLNTIKQQFRTPLNESQFYTLLFDIVSNATHYFLDIDPKCKGYCPRFNPVDSLATREIGDIYKSLETIGLTIPCLLVDAKSDTMKSVLSIMGGAAKAIATSDDHNLTSVEMLSQELKQVVVRLQKLSTTCVNVCYNC